VTAAEARQGKGQKGRKRLGQQPSYVTSGSARYKLNKTPVDWLFKCGFGGGAGVQAIQQAS
jgi:hypothetical protein